MNVALRVAHYFCGMIAGGCMIITRYSDGSLPKRKHIDIGTFGTPHIAFVRLAFPSGPRNQRAADGQWLGSVVRHI
jgi:hypothetical protein